MNYFKISNCNKLVTVELTGIDCRIRENDNIDGVFYISKCIILQKIEIGNNWYKKCESARLEGNIEIDNEIMNRSSRTINIRDRL